MAVTTWRYPGTTASVAASGDEVWNNPGNIVSDNASYASSTAVGGGGTTETLKATNFGFVSGDFPSGWTITGLEVEIERYAFDNGCTTRDSVVQFYDASGTLTGSNFADTATNYPASATIKAYGGAGNMLGTSLTASDLQDADFGVALKCVGTGGTGSDYSQPLVDYIRVRAHLTPPPSGYSIVGIGTVAETTATGGNLTLTEPSGVQEGDLLVAVISYRSNASFANTGSIWTKQEEENSGNTTANSTGSIGSGVAFWGIRGASAPDLVFERTGGNVARGCIIAYRPDDAGDTFEIDTSTSLTLAAASTSFTMSGFTPAQDATLLVWCGFGARNTTLSAFDAATDPTTASGTTTDTTTDPYFDTWLRRVTSGTATGADCTIAIADAVQETATATGNFTYTAGSSARHAGAVLAFRLVPISTGVEGTLAVTLDAATISATGEIAIAGNVSASLAVATLAATGDLDISGSLGVTLGDATLAASGSGAMEPIEGALSATLAAASLSATGALRITGAGAATLENAALAATGGLAISATLSASFADATLSAEGALAISADLAATLGEATISATGAVAIAAALAVTLDAATLDAAGGLVSGPITGALAVDLSDAILLASGAVAISGELSASLGAASLSASAALAIRGEVSASLADASLASYSALAISASLGVTLADTTLAGTGALVVPPSRINQAFAAAVPGADTFSAAVPVADAFAAAVPARDAFTAPVPANDSFRAAAPAMDEFRAVAA